MASGDALPAVTGFQLVRRIGRGGMGEVFHAVRVGPGGFRKTVALKQLVAGHSLSGRARQRFLEEAQVSAQLDHPNLVRVHDVVAAGSTYFIVMELLRGLNLVDAAEALRAQLGHVPWWFAFEAAAHVLDGLAYAHDASDDQGRPLGLVHRDLTPRNLFACVGGTLKILDFGIAKRHDGPSLTHSGHIHGTIELLSPEQARGERVDRRSDLYQLGGTLYWLLANRFPHGEGTPGELLARAANVAPSPLPDDVPAAVRAVIERAMAPREDRYPDAAAMARAVRDALASAPVHDTLAQTMAALPLLDPGESAEGHTISVTAEHTAAVAPEAHFVARPRRWPLIAVAFALAALVIGVEAGRRFAPSNSTREPALRWQRLTLDPGLVVDARFVPGHNMIVYSGRWESDRYSVREIADGENHARVLLADAVISAAATDALYVLLHPHGPDGLVGTLARMPLTGEGPRELVTDVTLSDVTADGKTLVVVRTQGGKSWIEWPIGQRLAETTGSYQAVRLEPSGDRLAAIEHDADGAFVTLIENGKARRIGHAWSHLTDLVWSPDGRELWVSAGSVENGSPTLVALELGGTNERTLATTPDALLLTDVDRSGRGLVVSGETSFRTVGDLAGDGTEHYLPTFYGYQPIASADLRYYLFQDWHHAMPEGDAPIYKVPIDGSSPPIAIADGIPLAAANDGKSGVLTSGRRDHIRIVPFGAGEAIEVPLGGLHDVRDAILFDDNRHLLVAATLGDEPPRVYAIGLAGGMPRPFPTEIHFPPDVHVIDLQSFDGTRFALVDQTGTPLLVAADTGTVSAIPGIRDGDAVMGWRADDRALFVATGFEDEAQLSLRGTHSIAGSTLVEVDLQTGARRVVRQFTPIDTSGGAWIAFKWFSRDMKRYIRFENVNHSYLHVVDGLR